MTVLIERWRYNLRVIAFLVRAYLHRWSVWCGAALMVLSPIAAYRLAWWLDRAFDNGFQRTPCPWWTRLALHGWVWWYHGVIECYHAGMPWPRFNEPGDYGRRRHAWRDGWLFEMDHEIGEAS